MWYGALAFRVAEQNHQRPEDALWEMQIFLVTASDDEEARKTAERLGKEHEHEYRNQAGDLISWKHVCVGGVFQISAEKLAHGTEVFSIYLQKPDVERILAPIE